MRACIIDGNLLRQLISGDLFSDGHPPPFDFHCNSAPSWAVRLATESEWSEARVLADADAEE